MLVAGFPAPEREVLHSALSGWGAEPIFVSTVDEALTRLVAEISVAKPFHSALLWSEGDLKLAQRFRKGAPDPAPPVILAVSRASQVPRFDALSAGFSAILESPFDKRQLFNVLHSVSAGEEVREGVIRLQDYAHRGAGVDKLAVLVADDNPTNREVLGKILERGGHQVTRVRDGDEALDALERLDFDVVILDRNMPGTGGIEALRAMRLMSRGRVRIPAIILSADATPEAKREAFEAGADAFLAKPIEAMRLLDEVQAVCRPEPSRRVEVAPLRPKAKSASAASEAPVVNKETLGHLEELGSSMAFVQKLAGVFIADNKGIMSRIEDAVATGNYADFRAHLHALKGSSASMGTERLTQLCAMLGAHSDAELRLQGVQVSRRLRDELAAASGELERYVQERQQSTN
jgi:two-component system sensor histidine kinase RpfC